jgi:predicted nucleic acid-binding protein
MLLRHFALADRIDVLGAYVVDVEFCTTYVVVDEIRRRIPQHPPLAVIDSLEWLRVLSLDTDAEILAFDDWLTRIGADEHNVGEASVFAAAQVRGHIALTDDRDATGVARKLGLEVHGTIWLLTRFCLQGKITEFEMCTLVDALRATGMRLPCTGSELPRWARATGLIGT